MSLFKWAENMLENVDQKAASSIRKKQKVGLRAAARKSEGGVAHQRTNSNSEFSTPISASASTDDLGSFATTQFSTSPMTGSDRLTSMFAASGSTSSPLLNVDLKKVEEFLAATTPTTSTTNESMVPAGSTSFGAPTIVKRRGQSTTPTTQTSDKGSIKPDVDLSHKLKADSDLLPDEQQLPSDSLTTDASVSVKQDENVDENSAAEEASVNIDYTDNSTIGSSELNVSVFDISDTVPATNATESQSNDEVMNTMREYLRQLVAEVQSLQMQNKQIASQCSKYAQEIQAKDRLALETRERLENQVDRLLKSKLSTDDEFAMALKSKESQLIQIQSKLDECVQQLKAKDHLIEEMQEERDRQLAEQVKANRSHQTAMQQLKEDYEKLEKIYTEERQQLKTTQALLESREKIMQQEKQQLEFDLAESQRSLSQREDEFARMESQLTIKETELRVSQQELQEYKLRANRVLQNKEKLIEELNSKVTTLLVAVNQQQQQIASGDSTASIAVDAALNALKTSATTSADGDVQLGGWANSITTGASDGDVNALREARDTAQEELERLRADYEELAASMDALKKQHDAENTSKRLKMRNIENERDREKHNVAKLQQTIATLKLSIDEMRQTSESERRTMQETVNQKNKELTALTRQLEQMSNNSVQSELETRLRSMAEHLIQKQSHIETINSEKAAILMQLENAHQRIREVELLSRISPMPRNYNNGSGDGYDIETAVPVRTNTFFSDLSKGGILSRRVARLMHFMDTLSIYTGRHLRRFPILRLVFVAYVVLLHLWVFGVLFASTPH